jgi:hypothetical protein
VEAATLMPIATVATVISFHLSGIYLSGCRVRVIGGGRCAWLVATAAAVVVAI